MLAMTSFVSASPAGESTGCDVRARLSEFLHRAVAHGFSGSAIVAIGENVLVHDARGLAHRAQNVPNTVETRFDIGSIAKQFTAAAVLRLQAESKLSVHDRVVRFFPGATVHRALEELTIHHLLTHTSGIAPDLAFQGVDIFSRDQTVVHILRSGGTGTGTRFAYANPNYYLLAAIIEVAAEEPFEAAIQRLVLGPAGMTESMFCQQPAYPATPIAWGFQPAGQQRRGGQGGEMAPAHHGFFGWGHKGATGLVTTTGDLHRWSVALAGDAVFDAATRQAFFTAHAQGYGYGWQIARTSAGHTWAEHGGSTIGFEASYGMCVEIAAPDVAARADIDPPPGLVAAVVMNTRGSTGPIASGLMRQLIRIACGEAIEPPPATVELGAEELAALSAYAGAYSDGEGNRYTISLKGVELVLQIRRDDAALFARSDPQQAAAYEERIHEALRAWQTGDAHDSIAYTSAFHELLPGHVRGSYTSRWSSTARPGNPLQRIVVLGTDTSSGNPESLLRLEYESTGELLRIFWRDGKIYGIGPANPAERMMTSRLLPESTTAAATMDATTWRTRRVVFHKLEGMPALSIRSDDGQTTAKVVP
jgi:CubicO group peptidase (beta-lactamase class C family)